MRPRAGEHGFTLIETLVVAALMVVLAGTLLELMQGSLGASAHLASERKAYVQLTHLEETWDAEASSALAIFVPAADVLGVDNSDGHELDFYTRDAQHQGHFWAYRWDAVSGSLQRYTYPRPGSQATATDPPLAGITAFQAVRKPASTVARTLMGSYAVRDVAVNFGYPGVDGGNAVTDVSVANARNRFEIELLPGAMVSGFQVVVATFAPSATPTPAAPSATPIATPSFTAGATATAAPSPSPAATPTLAHTATPRPSPTATATPTLTPTPAPTPTPCRGQLSITLTFFGLTWWEGQNAPSPCSGTITAATFGFSGFAAVDMLPLDAAFVAIPPFNGARLGYFVSMQDMNTGAALVPSAYVNAGDTIAASAAVPCKYIFMSNPATIVVVVAFGGLPLPSDDSAIPSIVTNLQDAIPGCVPVE